jgi:type I restriction enzyme R subunit
VAAIAQGQDRILLVMATGTGKTYTAFQIIWRLWKAGLKKRILFLADRNILVDQARNNDFKPFGGVMTKIGGRQVDKAYEVYVALYQAVSGTEDWTIVFCRDIEHAERLRQALVNENGDRSPKMSIM